MGGGRWQSIEVGAHTQTQEWASLGAMRCEVFESVRPSSLRMHPLTRLPSSLPPLLLLLAVGQWLLLQSHLDAVVANSTRDLAQSTDLAAVCTRYCHHRTSIALLTLRSPAHHTTGLGHSLNSSIVLLRSYACTAIVCAAVSTVTAQRRLEVGKSAHSTSAADSEVC